MRPARKIMDTESHGHGFFNIEVVKGINLKSWSDEVGATGGGWLVFQLAACLKSAFRSSSASPALKHSVQNRYQTNMYVESGRSRKCQRQHWLETQGNCQATVQVKCIYTNRVRFAGGKTIIHVKD